MSATGTIVSINEKTDELTIKPDAGTKQITVCYNHQYTSARGSFVNVKQIVQHLGLTAGEHIEYTTTIVNGTPKTSFIKRTEPSHTLPTKSTPVKPDIIPKSVSKPVSPDQESNLFHATLFVECAEIIKDITIADGTVRREDQISAIIEGSNIFYDYICTKFQLTDRYKIKPNNQ